MPLFHQYTPNILFSLTYASRMRWTAHAVQTSWEIAPREALAARRHPIDIAKKPVRLPKPTERRSVSGAHPTSSNLKETLRGRWKSPET
jgi:hypothetical protein